MISKHFTRWEFECKCGCGFDTVDVQLLATLEAVREHFGRPVIITSGCRCEAYNERVGGYKKSRHKLGRAADIVVKDVDPQDVYDWLDVHNTKGGVGDYSTFTHLDSRGHKARWKG